MVKLGLQPEHSLYVIIPKALPWAELNKPLTPSIFNSGFNFQFVSNLFLNNTFDSLE
jgi:hypothetical protein